jgi:hypothetical protein
MEHEKKLSSIPGVTEREQGFLNRVSRKYEKSDTAGQARSYLIASAVIMAMFSLSRWVPYWWFALIVVEVAGLALFRQYKRFAVFKSALLGKLWRHVREVSA